MRKFLLASVATLGTGGLTGAALAQAPAGPVGAPSQGQVAYPAAPSPTAYVNTNNNYQAPALPGALANPTPGTVVIHINGKVQVGFGAIWTSGDKVDYTRSSATGRSRHSTAPSLPEAPAPAPRSCNRRAPTPLRASISALTPWRRMGCAMVPGSNSATTPSASGQHHHRQFERLLFASDGVRAAHVRLCGRR